MHLLTGIQVGGSCTESVATQVRMVPDNTNEEEEILDGLDDEVPVPNLDDPDWSPLDEPSGQYVISPSFPTGDHLFSVGLNEKLV